MKKLLALIIVIVVMAVLVSSVAFACKHNGFGGKGFGGKHNFFGGKHKVTICHIPPGNPDNAHTITVGWRALRAHLAHGDYLGPCEPLPCTEAAWECTAWSECIDGEQTRTCTLIDTECSDPDAVKPAETQACAPQPECTSDDDCLLLYGEGFYCQDGWCLEEGGG